MSNTFVISDESVNSYGFKVITSGISLERFKKNPVMLYMHERGTGVIGRWENVRIKNKQLLADAVIDETDELGSKISKTVENGFLKSASIGIRINVLKSINNQDTVTDCDLLECSIVDIPSNENALALYDQEEKLISDPKKFVLSLGTDKEMLQKQLSKILCLNNATVETIIKEVTRLVNDADPDGIRSRLTRALGSGLISQAQFCSLMDIGYKNPEEFNTYFCEVENRYKEALKLKIDQCFMENSKKAIFADQKENLRKFAEKDFDLFNVIMSYIPDVQKLSDKIVKPGSSKDWGLTEYRKFAPKELQRNPDLFKRLLEQENDKNNI